MRNIGYFGVAVAAFLTLFAFTPDLFADDELAGYAGNYRLIEQHCPGGIAGSIDVGIYNGVGIVKTSLGYLFSINAAGGSVIVKNGPTTVCTGTMSGNKFTGSCLDNNRNYCAVVYQRGQ